MELNNAFRIAKPFLNKALAAHPYTFPTQVGDLFELTSLNLYTFNGYIYAGITPIFIGPSNEVLPESDRSAEVSFTFDEYELPAIEDYLAV